MKNNILNYLTLIIVICASIFFVTIYFNAALPINIYTSVGLLLIIPSLVFFTIARIQLGSSFQVSAKANKLVTKGIYKKASAWHWKLKADFACNFFPELPDCGA